jgi:hypothetical protein
MSWYKIIKISSRDVITIENCRIRWVDKIWDLSTYDKFTKKPTELKEEIKKEFKGTLIFYLDKKMITLITEENEKIKKLFTLKTLEIKLPWLHYWIKPIELEEKYLEKKLQEQKEKELLELENKRLKQQDFDFDFDSLKKNNNALLN